MPIWFSQARFNGTGLGDRGEESIYLVAGPGWHRSLGHPGSSVLQMTTGTWLGQGGVRVAVRILSLHLGAIRVLFVVWERAPV